MGVWLGLFEYFLQKSVYLKQNSEDGNQMPHFEEYDLGLLC